jgi:hypothetical protein
MPLLVIPYPAFDPVLVHLGPFAVRWYALAYIVGILLGWGYARILIRSGKLWGGKAPLTVTDFDDFVLWVTLGIILGGRIGYVLFYNLPYFCAPLEIFQLWNGGMSFTAASPLRGRSAGVRLHARHSGAFAGRHHVRRRPDRIVSWPHCEFHQRRIVGTTDGRPLGDSLSERWAGATASKPALRGNT